MRNNSLKFENFSLSRSEMRIIDGGSGDASIDGGVDTCQGYLGCSTGCITRKPNPTPTSTNPGPWNYYCTTCCIA